MDLDLNVGLDFVLNLVLDFWTCTFGQGHGLELGLGRGLELGHGLVLGLGLELGLGLGHGFGLGHLDLYFWTWT